MGTKPTIIAKFFDLAFGKISFGKSALRQNLAAPIRESERRTDESGQKSDIH